MASVAARQARSACVTRHFDAPPEDLFDAWLDPALIAQWMFDPGYREQIAHEICLDAREGGAFTFKLSRDGSPITYTGTFVKIARPVRLILTWRTVGKKGDSLLDVSFEARAGGTFVRLVHELGTVSSHLAKEVAGDWDADLASLARLLN